MYICMYPVPSYHLQGTFMATRCFVRMFHWFRDGIVGTWALSFRATLYRLCEATSRWSIKTGERRIPFLSYFSSHLLSLLHILHILRRHFSPFIFISSQLSPHKLPPLFPLRPVPSKSFSSGKSSPVFTRGKLQLSRLSSVTKPPLYTLNCN